MTVVANAVASKKKISVGGTSRFYEGAIQDVRGLLEKALLTGGAKVHFFERRSNVGDILVTGSG
jgi:hypothetical protein